MKIGNFKHFFKTASITFIAFGIFDILSVLGFSSLEKIIGAVEGYISMGGYITAVAFLLTLFLFSIVNIKYLSSDTRFTIMDYQIHLYNSMINFFAMFFGAYAALGLALVYHGQLSSIYMIETLGVLCFTVCSNLLFRMFLEVTTNELAKLSTKT